MVPETPGELLAAVQRGKFHHDRCPEVCPRVHPGRLIRAQGARKSIGGVVVVDPFEALYLGLEGAERSSPGTGERCSSNPGSRHRSETHPHGESGHDGIRAWRRQLELAAPEPEAPAELVERSLVVL